MKRPAGESFSGVLDTATLLRRGEVARDTHILDFEITGGHLPAAPPLPGQFYLLDCGGGREHLLRRPMSVHGVPRWGEGDAMLRFMVQEVGWGTRRLCSLEPGARVSLLGPLGRGFSYGGGGKRLIVAGGMGVAPLFFLGTEMDRSNVDYDFVAGFGSEADYYPWLGDLGVTQEVYTQDGSVGKKGIASDGARDAMERNNYSAVYTCGPEAMMEVVASLAEKKGVPCEVSLVSRMSCGIGACRGCVRPGRDGENLCVCTEGPVFDSRMVVWGR